MTDVELRNLDARVHQEVFGIPVLGEAPCWAPDGCWSVEPEADLEDGNFTLRPVYKKYQDQDETDTPWVEKFKGVNQYCLAPVPEYSTDMAAAWSVVEKLTEGEYVKVRCEQSHYHGDYCTVTSHYSPVQEDLVKRDSKEWGETMPIAICRAALKSVEVVRDRQ